MGQVDIQTEYNKWFELVKKYNKIEITIKNKQKLSINNAQYITIDLANQIVNSSLEFDQLQEELEICKIELDLQNSYLADLLNRLGVTKVGVVNSDTKDIWLVWSNAGQVKHERE